MGVIEIDRLDAPDLVPYSALTDGGLRRDGLFIAESPKVIERALAAGFTPLSILCEARHIGGDAAGIIAFCPEIPVYTGPGELLASLTGYRLTRGVLCAMKRPEPVPAESLVSAASRICVIYDVCDATNVGAIFRSAAALGYDAVILSRESCDPLNRRSIRVSMGAVFQIPWGYADDIPALLKAHSFVSVTTVLSERSVDLRSVEVDPESRYAVILGSEGYGLPRNVIETSDIQVCIPMKHGVDSLNVGAAAAIVLWHFCR